MATRLTDNSHFQAKVDLRLRAIRGLQTVHVLDAYAGTGRIWKEIRRQVPEKEIKVLPIEKEYGKAGVALYGDNRKFLSALPLAQYDVIDLDAYGMPLEQLEILRSAGYEGRVAITSIHAAIGPLPPKMLATLGIDGEIVERCPSIFARLYEEFFWGYLHELGCREVDYISFSRSMRKVYCVVTLRHNE